MVMQCRLLLLQASAKAPYSYWSHCLNRTRKLFYQQKASVAAFTMTGNHFGVTKVCVSRTVDGVWSWMLVGSFVTLNYDALCIEMWVFKEVKKSWWHGLGVRFMFIMAHSNFNLRWDRTVNLLHDISIFHCNIYWLIVTFYVMMLI